MTSALTLPPTARRVLELARDDRAAAAQALAELSPDDQVALVCETPLARRAELLDLLPAPEEVVPRLPEAELCFTIKAIGVGDAAWLVELASEEQVVACFDLDAWRGAAPDPRSLDEWMHALSETRTPALLRGVHALDPELVVQFLKQRIHVAAKPSAGDEDWQPPEGSQTLDGQFFYVARAEGDDLAPVTTTLRTLFERDYWTYFRLLQGVIWELDTENVEWAARWRNGRLEDLGFPRWEEAMQIYGYLAPSALSELPEDAKPFEVEAWHLPVWMPLLPAGADSPHLLFRAVAELDENERRASFYALVALANRVAVADRMPLGDADSIPQAIQKVAELASAGLAFVAERNGLSAVETLRRVPLARIFRVGANLEPRAAEER